MKRRHTDGNERTLEQNIEMILGSGFDGVSNSFTDTGAVQRAARLIKPSGSVIEALCFPRTIDDLKPTHELCTRIGVHHLDIQADVRPRKIADCIPRTAIGNIRGQRCLGANVMQTDSFAGLFDQNADLQRDGRACTTGCRERRTVPDDFQERECHDFSGFSAAAIRSRNRRVHDQLSEQR